MEHKTRRLSETVKGSVVHPALVERRRGSERRRRAGNPRLAPASLERRVGERRRFQGAVLLGAMALASGLAVPAAAGGRPLPSATPAPTATPAPAPRPTPGPPSTVNSLAGATLYVDPYSSAKQTADSWRSSRPVDAAELDKIASAPQAGWFGEWSGDVLSAVDARVSAAAATGSVPVLVAYDIPNRDCSGYSAGGAADSAAYRDWIRRFALGIGARQAVVVLEPDALAQLCGDAAQQQERLNLLWDAVDVLKANPATAVYLDAGHSTWLSTSVAASRLQAAGVAQADGFSLNVSNFNPTANEVTYGHSISNLVGGKHFVIDTSRNGLGPATTWCNPSGEALGARPNAATGQTRVDAYLWVKRPGESDGTCNGGPAAGTFWADYALGLAQRAAY